MKTIKRRRHEQKTNYSKRLKILKAKKPRIVFRKTNLYLIAQYIESKEAKDKVVFGINSKVLTKYGWPKNASFKSITAAYFLGLKTGLKIKKEKMKTPIVDFGMIRTNHQTKIYGFLKGLVDAELELKYKKDIFPSDERLQGGHLKNKINFEEIKSKILKNE